MRFASLSSLQLLLLPALQLLANLPFVRSANVCLLMYQMADNDLEYFIRQDLAELSLSELIKTPTLTTWVYFDNRNFLNDWDQDIFDPLPMVFNKDGSATTGDKPEGSFYFRQDHDLEKLVIEEELGELNSDSPGTVENFVNAALADCKARGSEEYMIVFSSHGGGFDGFGGDDNSRKLLQTNDDIASALRSALDANLGAGSKFDVIGFDACLMQAFGAADNYKSVANYLLASEELEPGHGWWYIDGPQSAGGSALDIAKYYQSSFVESLHGYTEHMTPKTLSIVDLNKFDTFLVKWEALSKEWVKLMEENDSEVAIMLSRARNTAYAFEASMDPSIDKNPSVDMYSFMETFKKLCPAGTDTALGQSLLEAMNAYTDMFVANSNGPGTPSGLTGMAVIFPTKAAYAKYSEYLHSLLIEDPSYATQAAPEWLNFLSKFYSTGTPPSGGSSVCLSSSTSTAETSSADQLLINPTVSSFSNGSHDIDMEVTRSVTNVIIEYGADFSPLLNGEIVGRRRLMAREKREQEGELRSGSRYNRRDRRQMEFFRERRRLEDQTSPPVSFTVPPTEDGSNTDDFTSPPEETSPPGEESFDDDTLGTSPPSTEESTNDNFLYIFAGDLLGNYDNSKYSASWDRSFWVIEDANSDIEGIYVYDMGEGLKEAPVIYFPPSSSVVSEDLAQLWSTEDALAIGGEYGFLEFSANNADESGFVSTVSLYTTSGDGSSYSEVPLSAGGQIVPIVECYGEIEGFEIYEWIGGFFLTVLDWGSENSIQMSKVDAADTLDFFEVDYYTIDVEGYDEDTDGFEFALFEFDRDGEMSFSMEIDMPGDDLAGDLDTDVEGAGEISRGKDMSGDDLAEDLDTDVEATGEISGGKSGDDLAGDLDTDVEGAGEISRGKKFSASPDIGLWLAVSILFSIW